MTTLGTMALLQLLILTLTYSFVLTTALIKETLFLTRALDVSKVSLSFFETYPSCPTELRIYKACLSGITISSGCWLAPMRMSKFFSKMVRGFVGGSCY
jgi:hypothetical protein